ncbi:MAG: SDR family NAD(P)-dependent oxidoreductase [Bacteroidales bacterium]|nr:SDR family NAD(P)-dependent oxidoreductase [Bacteroidales bacterium]
MENVLGYAVVTGASKGLGRELALELARRSYPTLLVSSTEAVHVVRKTIIGQYPVDCQSFVVNLADENEARNWAEKIAGEYPVSILINNVGTGGSRAFETADMDYLLRILHLNILCTTILTKSLLGNLKRNTPAHILNIGSMAGFTPTAYKTVYPASKAYVHDFTKSLREELKGTGISVTLAAPGAMATNPEITQRIEKQGFFGRATLKSTSDIARKYVDGMLRGKRLIILNPLSYFLTKIIPERWRVLWLSKIVKREL